MKNQTETERIALAESKLQARKQKLAEKEARRASKEVRALERDATALWALTERFGAACTFSKAIDAMELLLKDARASALAPKGGA